MIPELPTGALQQGHSGAARDEGQPGQAGPPLTGAYKANKIVRYWSKGLYSSFSP